MTLQEIKRLKYEYCYHLDRGNVDEFLTLFTDDAAFDVPNYSGQGLADIREFIEDISARDLGLLAHMASNPVIEVDGDEATGHWYYLVIIEDEEGATSWGQGRWEDEYRRVDGRWKIATLVANRQFTTELSD